MSIPEQRLSGDDGEAPAPGAASRWRGYSGDVEMTSNASAEQIHIIGGTPTFFVRVERRAGKLRRLADSLAERFADCARRGVEYEALAEAADELTRMAQALDALDPPVEYTTDTYILNTTP